jgi:hypothetical protein
MKLGATLSLLLVAFARQPCVAQTPERDVLAVVQRMFDGMRRGDSAMVRSTFDSTVQFLSVGDTNRVPTVATESVNRFITAVGKPHAQVWDERIWDPDINVDGALASVWTKYAFYLGDQFHHCGVDVFGLVRHPDGWKIVYLADTERQEACWRGPGG